jgi:hypothetical protein
LVTLAKRENSFTHFHSIEEAEARHRRKARGGRGFVDGDASRPGGPTAVAS